MLQSETLQVKFCPLSHFVIPFENVSFDILQVCRCIHLCCYNQLINCFGFIYRVLLCKTKENHIFGKVKHQNDENKPKLVQ